MWPRGPAHQPWPPDELHRTHQRAEVHAVHPVRSYPRASGPDQALRMLGRQKIALPPLLLLLLPTELADPRRTSAIARLHPSARLRGRKRQWKTYEPDGEASPAHWTGQPVQCKQRQTKSLRQLCGEAWSPPKRKLIKTF